MLAPMRASKVRRIVAAYTINRFGTWFGFVALSVVVFDHTHSAIAVAALLLMAQVIPAFLVPVVVARVEGSTRRGELTALYLFEATASGLLVLMLLWQFSLPITLVLVAFDGTAALAASALLRAAAARSAREWVRTLPGGPRRAEEVQQDEVEAERRANAALNIGFAATFVAGPALAGVVVPAFGVEAALLVDMVSFAICGLLLLDVAASAQDTEEAGVRERLRDAWSYLRGARTLRNLLLIEAAALAFFEFSPPIEVAYAKDSLHAGDSGYGLLLGTWGLGAAIGSVVFAKSINRSLRVLLSTSTLAIGLSYLGWAAAPTLALACLAGVLGGIGNGMQWAAAISAVQRLTPERLHGQLMGALESIGAISPGIGFALGSGIVALSSPRTALLVAGIGASVTSAVFLRLRIGVRAQAEPVLEGAQTYTATSVPTVARSGGEQPPETFRPSSSDAA